jgi:hypothetical protein
LIGADGGDALVDHPGGILEQLPAALLEFVEGDHPVAVALAVDDDDLHHTGQFGAMLAQLVELTLIFGDDDAAARVAHDVGDVVGLRARVHGGGGRTRAHDREVDEHPFVAGRRGKRHPVLGLNSERNQPCRNTFDALTDVSPGDAGPAVIQWIAERLP